MTTKHNSVRAKDRIAVTSIRTTRAQLEEFRRIAVAENRTVSQHLRHVMAREIAAHDEAAA